MLQDPDPISAGGDEVADPGESTFELLQNGTLKILRRLPWSSNETLLCMLTPAELAQETDLHSGKFLDQAHNSLLAVYKPAAGERPLSDFPPASLCRREVAAYELDSILGWNLVPPTVLRDGPVGEGSVQAFIHADPDEHYLTLRYGRTAEFMRIAVFDAIANNADRKSGHCLLDFNGRIWAIDHGICFHQFPKLRTVIWDFSGEPLPKGILSEIRAFLRIVEDSHTEHSSRLRELLSPGEMNALAARARSLADSGVFPMPGSGRSVPWPPV